MKRMVLAAMAGLMACSALSAQSIKLTNTFGGDADNTGSDDLFVYTNQEDEDGDYKNKFDNSTRVSDRAQLDVSSEKFDSRIRMEYAATALNGKNSTTRVRGFGRFKPVDQFQLIAGNEFFTKVPVNAGYLAASDDYPKYTRILQNGFGAISNWKLGEDVSLNLAGGIKGTDNSYNDEDKFGLDFGFNFGVKKLLSVGGAFQNVTGDNLSAGIFAGLNAVENLTLNAGYIYNAYDTDFITASAKNALSLTAAYNVKDAGLFVGADVVCALSNEFIDGSETEKYVNEDGDKEMPLFARVRAEYKATSDITLGAKLSVKTMIGDSDITVTEVYPNASYKLPQEMGTVAAGVRLDIDSDGLAKIAIPMTWKYTFNLK